MGGMFEVTGGATVGKAGQALVAGVLRNMRIRGSPPFLRRVRPAWRCVA